MRIAACAVIVRDGRFLLGRRKAARAYYPGVWDLFGGHAHAGEDTRSALVRELREELGIHTVAAEALLVAPEPNPTLHGPGEFHLFLVTLWDGEPAVRNDEHDAMGWFTPAEASGLELAHPAILEVLEWVASPLNRKNWRCLRDASSYLRFNGLRSSLYGRMQCMSCRDP